MVIRLVRPHKRAFAWLEVAGVAGLVLLLVARFVPEAQLPGCMVRRLTGIPCPACGMTRAFVWLTHGRIPEAASVSPLGLTLALVALVAAAYLLLWPLRPPRLAVRLTSRERAVAMAGIVGLVLLNWFFVLVAGG